MKSKLVRRYFRRVLVAFCVFSFALYQTSVLAAPKTGSLKGLGSSVQGQFGNGQISPSDITVPEQISSGTTEVAAGLFYSLFLKSDGTLWAVGQNAYGQLGDGTTTERLAPVQIDTNVAFVAVGESSSFYIKKDGTLWGMGRNDHGQLGDGTVVSRAVPIQIATGVASVAASTNQTFYLKTDQT